MNIARMPGFTADISLLKGNSHYGLAAPWLRGEGIRQVVIPQDASSFFSWWCDLFPWLCAVCSPCTALGIQHCCEPGRYICTDFGICYRQWLCYDRRC